MTPDDDTPTEYAPTELAQLSEPSEAWSLVEDVPEPRSWRPVFAAVAGALVLAVVPVVLWVASRPSIGEVAMITPDHTATSRVPEVGPSGFEVPPPPPPSTVTVTKEPPAPVAQDALPAPLWTVADDRRFIANLRANGWSIWDPAEMANNAHFVCSWLQTGESPEVTQFRLTDISRDEARTIVRVAMQTYPNCP